MEKKEDERDSSSDISLPTKLKLKKFTHDLEAQDIVYNNEWKSCCLTFDKRAIVYFTQMTFIGCLLIFCIYKLIESDECDVTSPYLALLSSLIGLVIPAPSFNN